jgi:hypothetical protein
MAEVDFAGLLAQKYAIQQQQADAQSALQRSQANITNVNAAQIPGLTASEIGLRTAQAGLFGAQGGLLGAQTGTELDRTAGANPFVAFDTARNALAGTGQAADGTGQSYGAPTQKSTGYTSTRQSLTDTNADGSLKYGPNAGIVPTGLGAPKPATPIGRSFLGFHYSTGTARVPGKGDGTVDKVKAKLAPGEAVLNKGAADLAGREAIEHLNALGMLHMGMTPTPPQNDPQTAEPKAAEKGVQALKTGGVVKPMAKGKEQPAAAPGKGKAPTPEELTALMHMMHAHGQGVGMAMGMQQAQQPPMQAGMPPGMPGDPGMMPSGPLPVAGPAGGAA